MHLEADMINAVSNYEKTKLSMANVFLQYDQDTMIAKFSLKHDPSCCIFLLLSASIVSTGNQEMFNGQRMILKLSAKQIIMKQ